MGLEIRFSALVNVATVLFIILGLMSWGLFDLCTSYQGETCQPVYLQMILPLMALIVLWSLKLRFFRQLLAQNVFVIFLLLYGGFLTIYMIREILSDIDEFIIYFPVCLYGAMVLLCAYTFIRERRTS